jgi:hypothetical protein
MSSERAPFADIEREWSRRVGRPMTVDNVIRRWEYFTVQVAHGYPESIYEYTNEISVRTKIAELETGAVPLPAHLARRVAESDARFRESSTELPVPFAGYQAPRSAWWWFRCPTNMGPDLQADLARVEPA